MKNVPLIIDITEINSYKSHLKANVIFGNCMGGCDNRENINGQWVSIVLQRTKRTRQ